MRQIKEIIVHCSATREGADIPVETIKDWHVNGSVEALNKMVEPRKILEQKNKSKVCYTCSKH